MTVMVTDVPGSPRITVVRSLKVMLAVDLPPTAVIWSPALTPAFAAGVSPSTRLTLKAPLSSDRTTPMPAMLLVLSCDCMAAYSAAIRNSEWPVSPRLLTMPAMEPYNSCWSVTEFRPTKFPLTTCKAWSYRAADCAEASAPLAPWLEEAKPKWSMRRPPENARKQTATTAMTCGSLLCRLDERGAPAGIPQLCCGCGGQVGLACQPGAAGGCWGGHWFW